MNLFRPEKNKGYERMTERTTELVTDWFNSDEDIFDDPRFTEPAPEEKAEAVETETLLAESTQGDKEVGTGKDASTADGIAAVVGGEESPVDIAAAASLTSLPDGDLNPAGLEIPGVHEASQHDGDANDAATAHTSEEKKAYLQYLMGIAERSGSNLRSYLPSKLPSREQMTMPKVSLPGVSIPAMPNMPTMPNMSMPAVPMPSLGMFSKKKTAESTKNGEGVAVGEKTSETETSSQHDESGEGKTVDQAETKD